MGTTCGGLQKGFMGINNSQGGGVSCMKRLEVAHFVSFLLVFLTVVSSLAAMISGRKKKKSPAFMEDLCVKIFKAPGCF